VATTFLSIEITGRKSSCSKSIKMPSPSVTLKILFLISSPYSSYYSCSVGTNEVLRKTLYYVILPDQSGLISCILVLPKLILWVTGSMYNCDLSTLLTAGASRNTLLRVGIFSSSDVY
jgi:hypothetical protein